MRPSFFRGWDSNSIQIHLFITWCVEIQICIQHFNCIFNRSPSVIKIFWIVSKSLIDSHIFLCATPAKRQQKAALRKVGSKYLGQGFLCKKEKKMAWNIKTPGYVSCNRKEKNWFFLQMNGLYIEKYWIVGI